MYSTFGQFMKEKMKEKGMSQADLVRQTNIPSSVISAYYNDKYSPKEDNKIEIEKALGEYVPPYAVDIETFNRYRYSAEKEFDEIYKDYERLISINKNLPYEMVRLLSDLLEINDIDEIHEEIEQIITNLDSKYDFDEAKGLYFKFRVETLRDSFNFFSENIQ